jgi:radical SAM superfamily enzyme YgiQ (UPF0313 family)
LTQPRTIAFVSVNATANLARIRWEDRKLLGGSIAEPSPDQPPRQTRCETLPYQYALLRAYIEQFGRRPGGYRFLDPCLQAESVEETARHCAGADLVGYSVYIWNENFNLAVARRVKELNPRTVNCVGGPQVPAEAGAYLRRHPWIDLACWGEGEEAFLQAAEHLETRDWRNCPATGWVDDTDRYRWTDSAFMSTATLAGCTSPYAAGVLDPFLERHPRVHWLMPLETNRGCPFACAYCGWSGTQVNHRVRRFPLERIQDDLEWARRHGIAQILVCDANFGLLARDVDIVDSAIAINGQDGPLQAFCIQTSCVVTERVHTIHRRLAAHHLEAGATVGVQSRSPEVLDLCRRRYLPRPDLAAILERYARDRVPTYCDLILGLPGETYASFTRGIGELVACGQYNSLFVYPFSPLRNTVLATMEARVHHAFGTVRQKLGGTHTRAGQRSCVAEEMEIVVAGATLPAESWRRAKAFLNLTQLLFFSRLLHLPMVLGSRILDLDFATTIEILLQARPDTFPVMAELSRMSLDQARAVQENGAPDTIPAAELGDVWWPWEQYALIRLVRSGRLSAFYEEAGALLQGLLPAGADEWQRLFLAQALALNQALLRVPFVTGNIFFETDFNLKALYRGCLGGLAPPCVQRPEVYQIIRTRPQWRTWQGWYDHLMFCHNQKTYYLYGFRLVDRFPGALEVSEDTAC